MDDGFTLPKEYGLAVKDVRRNPVPARLYEDAMRLEPGSKISSQGALVCLSGLKTGRSPKDKRVVGHPQSEKDIWWGSVNIALEPSAFARNRERAQAWLNTRSPLYCLDGFAGWDPAYRLKIRVICSRPYHAAVHAQHADPARRGGAAAFRRARLRDLQRRPVSGQPPHRTA